MSEAAAGQRAARLSRRYLRYMLFPFPFIFFSFLSFSFLPFFLFFILFFSLSFSFLFSFLFLFFFILFFLFFLYSFFFFFFFFFFTTKRPQGLRMLGSNVDSRYILSATVYPTKLRAVFYLTVLAPRNHGCAT
jgi:hypothetical protein